MGRRCVVRGAYRPTSGRNTPEQSSLARNTGGSRMGTSGLAVSRLRSACDPEQGMILTGSRWRHKRERPRGGVYPLWQTLSGAAGGHCVRDGGRRRQGAGVRERAVDLHDRVLVADRQGTIREAEMSQAGGVGGGSGLPLGLLYTNHCFVQHLYFLMSAAQTGIGNLVRPSGQSRCS